MVKAVKKNKDNSAWELRLASTWTEERCFFFFVFFFIEVFLFFAIHKRHSKLKYFEC